MVVGESFYDANRDVRPKVVVRIFFPASFDDYIILSKYSTFDRAPGSDEHDSVNPLLCEV
jgi:hypothetical protein